MLPLEELYVKQVSATLNLVTNPAFATGPMKTKENLDRVGESKQMILIDSVRAPQETQHVSYDTVHSSDIPFMFKQDVKSPSEYT
jgi:hypothetical protein